MAPLPNLPTIASMARAMAVAHGLRSSDLDLVARDGEMVVMVCAAPWWGGRAACSRHAKLDASRFRDRRASGGWPADGPGRPVHGRGARSRATGRATSLLGAGQRHARLLDEHEPARCRSSPTHAPGDRGPDGFWARARSPDSQHWLERAAWRSAIRVALRSIAELAARTRGRRRAGRARRSRGDGSAGWPPLRAHRARRPCRPAGAAPLRARHPLRHASVGRRGADPALHERPMPGANDGTSGVAVVLELLAAAAGAAADGRRRLDRAVRRRGARSPRRSRGYCMGSRYLAERITAGEHPLLAKSELGIVLDMVGDRDLRVLIEPGSQASHRTLSSSRGRPPRSSASPRSRPRSRARHRLDDHKFLDAAGIPSVLLIDREYAHWHSAPPTPIDQVSAASRSTPGYVVPRARPRWFAPRAQRLRADPREPCAFDAVRRDNAPASSGLTVVPAVERCDRRRRRRMASQPPCAAPLATAAAARELDRRALAGDVVSDRARRR